MSLHFILVAGPLVRASSWEPTAECLRAAGCHVQVPDVLAHHHVAAFLERMDLDLLEHVTRGHEPIVVGHSSASALAADLATRLPARGIIIVDGDVPPSRGAAFPVRPALHDFIKGLVEPDGMLPIWSQMVCARYAAHVACRSGYSGARRGGIRPVRKWTSADAHQLVRRSDRTRRLGPYPGWFHPDFSDL